MHWKLLSGQIYLWMGTKIKELFVQVVEPIWPSYPQGCNGEAGLALGVFVP